MGPFGVQELLLVFLVALLLFGAKRLPEIGSSLGKGIREFKGSVREMQREMKVTPDRTTIHNPQPEPHRLRPADSDGRFDEPRRLTTSDSKD